MLDTVGSCGLADSSGLGDCFLALNILHSSGKGNYPYDHEITSVCHFFHALTKYVNQFLILLYLPNLHLYFEKVSDPQQACF